MIALIYLVNVKSCESYPISTGSEDLHLEENELIDVDDKVIIKLTIAHLNDIEQFSHCPLITKEMWKFCKYPPNKIKNNVIDRFIEFGWVVGILIFLNNNEYLSSDGKLNKIRL